MNYENREKDGGNVVYKRKVLIFAEF